MAGNRNIADERSQESARPFAKPWQQIDSRVVFDHPRLRLVEDTVQSPDGERTKWLYSPGAQSFVLIIAEDATGRLLVSHQYNYPPNKVVDEFPGGGIAPGESPEDAGRRELLEETGWYAHTVVKIGQFRVDSRRTNKICHVLHATNLEQRAPAPEAFEIIQSDWYHVTDLIAAVGAGKIENGNLMAALVVYGARLAGAAQP